MLKFLKLTLLLISSINFYYVFLVFPHASFLSSVLFFKI